MLGTAEVVLLTVIAAAIVACAQYVFKKYIHKFKFNLKGMLSLLTNRMVIAGAAIYIMGLFVYLAALGSGQLSFVYPAFSSTFIFVMIISHFMLDEKVGYARLAGLALIIIGIALVATGL